MVRRLTIQENHTSRAKLRGGALGALQDAPWMAIEQDIRTILGKSQFDRDPKAFLLKRVYVKPHPLPP